MKNIFWFRRDLRIEDNAGLYHALRGDQLVQCIFIFDTNILDKLVDQADPRVSFIHNALSDINSQLKEFGATLHVYHGKPIEIWEQLINEQVGAVYTNRDYESYALNRDAEVEALLRANGIEFNTYKDHVIFEGHEILKKDNTPYTVFTPYKKKWLAKLQERKNRNLSYYFKPYPTLKYTQNLEQAKKGKHWMELEDLGFSPSETMLPDNKVSQKLIKAYESNRNFPSINGTSRLGIHFRFGTISIREKARKSEKLSDVFLSELIWRDFYSQILSHFPHVEKNAFRSKYEKVQWRYDEQEFKAWCDGRTGYPMVDAGMRELNSTGHMHNRVRMVVASFLTKHLLMDWRLGEAYFADKLLDFDLASNNGGWQWAAGCGTDAAPYFRIFNPTSQQQKFDKEYIYIKKWIKEWGTDAYPAPIVEHKLARERCLKAYKEALN